MIETNFEVKNNKKIADSVYEMTISCQNFAPIKAGQFLNVTVSNELTLKRPFGIIDYDASKKELKFAYRVVGKGTQILSTWKSGQQSTITFPLGNGFEIEEGFKKIAIVGGGLGVFPLKSLFSNKDSNFKFYSFLGYNNKDNCYYLDEFKSNSQQTFVTTDDGSFGEKGFITSVFEREYQSIKPDITLACGPAVMLKSLQKVTQKLNGKCLASTEERMGCGIGACLVCTCKIAQDDQIFKKRVCKDGPVFDLSTMIFDK